MCWAPAWAWGNWACNAPRNQAFGGLGVLVTASVVISLALSPMFNLTTELIVGSAPPERAGAASGISETGAELGGALGISILGSAGAALYRVVLPMASRQACPPKPPK